MILHQKLVIHTEKLSNITLQVMRTRASANSVLNKWKEAESMSASQVAKTTFQLVQAAGGKILLKHLIFSKI